MITYVDEHRSSYGVEPICRTLQVAPSSYYAARARPPAARSVEDGMLKDLIVRIHRANFGVYGARKAWLTLKRLGIEVGRDRVARLMREVGLQGATRVKRVRTTRPALVARRPADLVERAFTAAAPDRLWVADITYVPTWQRYVFLACVIDAWSRKVVGWSMRDDLHAELALDALGMALTRRRPRPGLVDRAPRPAQLPQPRRGEDRGLHLHRGLLQHPPATLDARLPKPGPLRRGDDQTGTSDSRRRLKLRCQRKRGNSNDDVGPSLDDGEVGG